MVEGERGSGELGLRKERERGKKEGAGRKRRVEGAERRMRKGQTWELGSRGEKEGEDMRQKRQRFNSPLGLGAMETLTCSSY